MTAHGPEVAQEATSSVERPPAAEETKRERWIRENLPAMQAWNAYLEEHGLPLAASRQF